MKINCQIKTRGQIRDKMFIYVMVLKLCQDYIHNKKKILYRHPQFGAGKTQWKLLVEGKSDGLGGLLDYVGSLIISLANLKIRQLEGMGAYGPYF